MGVAGSNAEGLFAPRQLAIAKHGRGLAFDAAVRAVMRQADKPLHIHLFCEYLRYHETRPVANE